MRYPDQPADPMLQNTPKPLQCARMQRIHQHRFIDFSGSVDAIVVLQVLPLENETLPTNLDAIAEVTRSTHFIMSAVVLTSSPTPFVMTNIPDL